MEGLVIVTVAIHIQCVNLVFLYGISFIHAVYHFRACLCVVVKLFHYLFSTCVYLFLLLLCCSHLWIKKCVRCRKKEDSDWAATAVFWNESSTDQSSQGWVNRFKNTWHNVTVTWGPDFLSSNFLVWCPKSVISKLAIKTRCSTS